MAKNKIFTIGLELPGDNFENLSFFDFLRDFEHL
jgi:hypothetical protein